MRFPHLRVALLGCGAVGAGVLDCLLQWPDLFELNPVLVRHPERRGPHGSGASFTDDLEQALAGEPDLLVELIGGVDYPASVMSAALRRGVHVVTANKAAVAAHYDTLHACAESGAVSLAYAAAVGGGTPVLETIDRLRGADGIVAIEGVMNGTANFLLSRLGEGWSYAQALARAQELGFAEADALADVDGHDAADKLSILVRRAFRSAIPAERIGRDSLRDVRPQDAQTALRRGQVLKQVGRCRLAPDGSIQAEVRIEALARDHVLAGAQNEENRFALTDGAGRRHLIYGKGAGRWPTTAAVFGDIMDLQRTLAAAAMPANVQRLIA